MDLAALYATAPQRSLRGAVSNRRGELLRIWQELLDENVLEVTDEALWSGLQGLTLGGGFTGEGAFVATLEFHLADAELAARAEKAVRAALGRALIFEAFEITASTVEGSRVLRIAFFGSPPSP